VLRRLQAGVTMIELLMGLAIVGMLMFVAVPSFSTFLQNTQIRNAAETTMSGLNLARAEALRRNTTIRFQFVSDLTSACTLSSASLSWVVSVADPVGACDATPSDTTAPQIVQKRSAADGTSNITAATTGGTAVTFNGLGRLTGSGITQVDFSNARGGVCEHVDPTNGTMRCLRVMISSGGQAKMCDPKVTTAGPPYDSRACV
jgi:type IV fimbrial biogenesis protein FimT